MTDLETTVRDELAVRGEAAGPWRVAGPELRAVARRRRARRLRVAAVAASSVLVVGGVLALSADPTEPDRPRVDRVTEPPDPDPEPSWTRVPLTEDMFQRAVTAALGGTDMRVLVSVRLPGSEQVVAVLTHDVPEDGTVRAVTVTFDSTEPGARVRRGTGARYASYDSLIAQPAYDGDGAVLVVVVPSTVGDTVEVVSSAPGGQPVRTSAFLRHRLALVPIASPEAVTRLRLLQRGEPRLDTIPAGSLLGPDVPRTLERVVASTGTERPAQPVQVRTDGSTACRVTAGGWWPQGQAYVDWNPFDAACAAVDGGLRLLLADDRRYSSVAGIAPPPAASVRLHWRDDSVTTVPTTGGDVNAFLGPLSRRADRLVLAEAVGRDGAVIASAVP